MKDSVHDVGREFAMAMVRLEKAEHVEDEAPVKKKAPAKKKYVAKKKKVVTPNLPEETQDITDFEVKNDEIL